MINPQSAQSKEHPWFDSLERDVTVTLADAFAKAGFKEMPVSIAVAMLDCTKALVAKSYREGQEQGAKQHFEAWWTDYCRNEAHNMNWTPVAEYFTALQPQPNQTGDTTE
jgi:hypothetical protein